MSSFVSRLLACLVAVVAVLQLIHLVLLNQLENRRLNELTQIQNQFHPLPPEEVRRGGRDREGNIANSRRRKLLKESYGYGPRGVDFNENEILMDRLFNEEENTIVDATGEYRVVFDIAGPQRDAIIQSQTPKNPQEKPPLFPGFGGNTNNNNHNHINNNDDFSIDEDITDQEPPPSEDITLVTYGDITVGKKYLVPLLERWTGPLSVVLFASNTSSLEATLDFIAHVRLCSDMVRQYVNFHIVFPLVETHLRYTTNSKRINNKTKAEKHGYGSSNGNGKRGSGSITTTGKIRRRNNVSSSAVIDWETECQYFLEQKDMTTRSENDHDLFVDLGSGSGSTVTVPLSSTNYPANLLRNVGRKRVLTEYSLVIPMFMLPSEGLRSKFHKMAKRRKDVEADAKTVFVIPSFETKNEEKPKNKKELLKLVQNYQARPYHFELCWKCQVHTDYESWGREVGKHEELSIMYEVLWKDPWEPFFISPNSVPLFDEGFRHISVDRLSNLCELHVAGFKFAVLNEPFLIHPGYITPTPFHVNANKGTSNVNYNLDVNRARFRQFKHELKNRYPHSTRRCY